MLVRRGYDWRNAADRQGQGGEVGMLAESRQVSGWPEDRWDRRREGQGHGGERATGAGQSGDGL